MKIKRIIICILVGLPLWVTSFIAALVGLFFLKSRLQSFYSPDQDRQTGVRLVYAPCGCAHFEITTPETMRRGAKIVCHRFHFGECRGNRSVRLTTLRDQAHTVQHAAALHDAARQT